jgi:hypothetical protein
MGHLTVRRLAVVLLLSQLAFTFTVRFVLVPRTSARHWQYGLIVDSDSAVFHTAAVSIVDASRHNGWGAFTRELRQGYFHVRILAFIYQSAGSSWPGWIYILYGFFFALNGILLSRMLSVAGMPERPALRWSLAISLTPLNLFSYSELLREPFVITAVFLFLYGVLRLTMPPNGGVPRSPLRGAVGCVLLGFVVASLFRPYLQLLLIAALTTTLGIALMYWLWRQPFLRREQAAALIVTGAAMCLLTFRSPLGEVGKLNDRSVLSDPRGDAPGALPDVQRQWAEIRESGRDFTYNDFATGACTVPWVSSAWVPRVADDKLQSLACAREAFLKTCDERLLGSRADRFCDTTPFTSAADILVHFPKAVVLGLTMPLPRVWFDGFGSNGTGLRRVGYLIDGVFSYSLLLGLVFVGRMPSDRRAAFIAVGGGIVALIGIYELATPSQFILARMRLSSYLPLLGLGATGWWVLWSSRDRKTLQPLQ